MAAGGGTFTANNKVLPEAYINFISKARALGTVGERGTAVLLYVTGWGNSELISISAEDFQKNCLSLLGFDYTADKILPLREIFAGGASEILLYTGDTGTAASASANSLTVKAVKAGSRGNSIIIVISVDADDESLFVIKTYMDGSLVDSQTVESTEDFETNDFISISGTLSENAGISLSGGADIEPSGSTYSTFLGLVEAENFTTVMYNGTDSTTKALFAAFVKRLRDEEGYKVTCVLYNYDGDYEGIINVTTAAELVYFTAGATAGADINESLTNMAYSGEYDISVSYTKSQLKAAIANGEFVYYNDLGTLRVLKDINSLVTVTTDKNSDFQNNQVIRVLDGIGNDVAKIFNNYYLGKVQNDTLGRDIFRSEVIEYCGKLQSMRAIDEFSSDDVTVYKGDEKGDVVVNFYVEPVSAMEKLYMTCIVE
ncbi:MAG: phage tail sheath family protein [Clostridiales bacterium]|nr:phage tail sheath family protein [Clostridiales bacterium]